MKHYLKTPLAALITLALALSAPLAGMPVAHAAVTQTDTSQVFTKCMEKGTIVAVAREGVQVAIEAAVAASASGVSTGAAGVASTVMVPTTNPTLSATEGFTSGITTASATWQDGIRPYLDEMAYITGQCALEQMTANTISWIKGGFHGSPSFAINPKKLYTDLQASVANQLARQVVDVRLTDFIPGFSNNLTKSIQLSTRVNSQGKFNAAIKATLPQYLPPNTSPQAFYNDFNKGGWGAFGASLETNNNPFGVMIIVGDELAARQLEAATTQRQQLDWSKGFIDIVDTDNCDYPTGGNSSDPENSSAGGITLGANGQPDPSVYDPAEITSLQRQYCDVTTPGSILSSQLDKTLGTDLDRLGFADNVDKIITALISKLVQDTVRHVF